MDIEKRCIAPAKQLVGRADFDISIQDAVQFLLQLLHLKDAKARATAFMPLQAMQSLNASD